MTLLLRPGRKWTSIALQSLSLADNVPAHLEYAGGLHVTRDPDGLSSEPYCNQRLAEAYALGKALRDLHTGQDYARIRMGFDAFLRGLREHIPNYRLPQLVRAIEGIIKPPVGETGKKFVHRCQTFTGASDETRGVLTEIYRIRSRHEHLHPWDDALKDYDLSQRNEIGMRRLRQAEPLARYIYRRILSSPSVRARFISDEHIDKFWHLPDHERPSIWGKQFDLLGIT